MLQLAWFTILFQSLLGSLHSTSDLEKPAIYAFVGTKWCAWSEKMLEEILTQDEFLQTIGSEFHLECIEVASDGSNALHYPVDQVPLMVLMDSQGKEMAQVGFLPLSARAFGEYLKKIVGVEREIEDSIGTVDLQELYKMAQQYHLALLQEKLLEQGLQQEDNTFFLLEKYRSQLFAQSHYKILKRLRDEIVERDPENQESAHLNLALIEFAFQDEHLSEPQEIVKPLKRYLKKFGKQYPEHYWSLKFKIAQCYYEHGKKNEAVTQLQKAIAHCPEEYKFKLQQELDFMQGGF